MLLSVLHKRKAGRQLDPSERADRRARTAGVIAIAVIAIALTVQLAHVFWQEKPRELLARADGLIEGERIVDIASAVRHDVRLPAERFGAEVAAAGAYVRGLPGSPPETTVLVLARDQQRFAEIAFKPGRTLEEERRLLGEADDVALGTRRGAMAKFSPAPSSCLRPNELSIGVCPIAAMLVFEAGGGVYALGADQKGASQGELVAMARSLISSIDGDGSE